jgi:predicted PurR-regulated permease PerM
MGEHSAKPSTATDSWTSRHLWQIQPVRDLLMIASLFAVLYLGYLTRLVTVPLLLAMALAYMLEPVVRLITSGRRITRQGAAAILILLASVLVIVPAAIGLTFGTIQAAQGVQSLARNAEWLVRAVERPDDKVLTDNPPGEAWADIRAWILDQQAKAKANEAAWDDYRRKLDDREALEQTHAALSPEEQKTTPLPHDALVAPPKPSPLHQATAWGVNWLRDNREQIGKRALQTGAEWVNAALKGLTSVGFLAFSAFLVAFFFYFISTNYARVLAFWEEFIPTTSRSRTVSLLSQMDRVIAGFIRGRLTICLCLMVYFTLAYGLIGVPGFLILGPVVGLLSLLPYVAGLGAPAAMLLMWLNAGDTSGFQNEWWWIVGAPLAVSLLSQVLDDYILSPIIQGKNTDMDMPSILFASIAGGALAGVYGLLLAIPAAACLKILLREVFWPRFRAWTHGKAADFIPLDDPIPAANAAPPKGSA